MGKPILAHPDYALRGKNKKMMTLNNLDHGIIKAFFGQ
jgi:hypothetical protein